MTTYQINSSSSFSAINAVIANASSGDTVHFNSGTYTFTAKITLKSGVNLTGDYPNTIMYAPKEFLYVDASEGTDAYNAYQGYIQGDSVSNITISGFWFKTDCTGNGTSGKDTPVWTWGHGGSRNCINVNSCSNITIHNCGNGAYIHNDFILSRHSTNTIIYNCVIVGGHAGIQNAYGTGGKIYNNDITEYCNSGIRLYYSTTCQIYNNTIRCGAGGQDGFQLQSNCNGCSYTKNIVYNFTGSSQCMFNGNYSPSASGSITLNDNVWWDCSGGIKAGSATLSGTNNNQTGGNESVSYWEGQGYGYQGSITPPSTITKYIARDGSGDYNCDGVADDVQINQAFTAANGKGWRIYFKSGTYDIQASCLIGSETEVTGDSDAILRLHNSLSGWNQLVSGQTYGHGYPILGQIGGYGTVVHDISIHGFQIDGNEINNNNTSLDQNGGGKDLYRLISMWGGGESTRIYNIDVYSMTLRNCKNDGVRIRYGKNINVYSNTITNCQHCCTFLEDVTIANIYSNTGYTVSCSGDRLDGCQNVTINNETFTVFTGTSGYGKYNGYCYEDNAIQIGDRSEFINCSNIIVKSCSLNGGVNGIWIDSVHDGCNIKVYNNTISSCGFIDESTTRYGGIAFTFCGNGISIFNNTIDLFYVAGININTAATGSTRTISITNNNFTNGHTNSCAIKRVITGVTLTITHNYFANNPTNFCPNTLSDSNPATSPNGLYDDGSGGIIVPSIVISCVTGSWGAGVYSFKTIGGSLVGASR